MAWSGACAGGQRALCCRPLPGGRLFVQVHVNQLRAAGGGEARCTSPVLSVFTIHPCSRTAAEPGRGLIGCRLACLEEVAHDRWRVRLRHQLFLLHCCDTCLLTWLTDTRDQGLCEIDACNQAQSVSLLLPALCSQSQVPLLPPLQWCSEHQGSLAGSQDCSALQPRYIL